MKNKNIWLLPTDKPSRLHKIGNKLGFTYNANSNPVAKQHNIYITSDEKPKEGDWCLSKLNEVVRFGKKFTVSLYKKIILTTDVDLIKDDIQSIGDDFLEWFVKNPSCEMIYVNKLSPITFDKTKNVNRYDKKND